MHVPMKQQAHVLYGNDIPLKILNKIYNRLIFTLFLVKIVECKMLLPTNDQKNIRLKQKIFVVLPIIFYVQHTYKLP